MTHPIHKYRAIAAKWDEIIQQNDGGKLRRPITAEECCRMVAVWAGWSDAKSIYEEIEAIREHLEKAKNGV